MIHLAGMARGRNFSAAAELQPCRRRAATERQLVLIAATVHEAEHWLALHEARRPFSKLGMNNPTSTT